LQRTAAGSEGTHWTADDAASFAESWSALVASFELWHKEVGGVVISYDRAIAAEARDIEAHLAERLAPVATLLEYAPIGSAAPELSIDAAKAIVQRAAEIAGRCGYRLAIRNGAEAQPSLPIERVAHSAERRVNCAVLVPATWYIEPDCDDALRELEHRGYAVKRMHGASPVDHARSMLATVAVEQGFDETLWVDADTGFDPDAVERLRSHNLPIVAGLYSRRGPGAGWRWRRSQARPRSFRTDTSNS
jgi:hypothetical protein